jgi:hypothetical protein
MKVTNRLEKLFQGMSRKYMQIENFNLQNIQNSLTGADKIKAGGVLVRTPQI